MRFRRRGSYRRVRRVFSRGRRSTGRRLLRAGYRM